MGSHDFIRFPPQLGYLSGRIWLLLGEIQATLTMIGATRLLPADEYDLGQKYLAKSIHGTTAIEGNLLSEGEVSSIIRGEHRIQGLDVDQVRQIRNMIGAYIVMQQEISSGAPPPFSLEVLNQYHRLVLDGLQPTHEGVFAVGALRSHNVEVGPYLAPPPDDCEILLRQFCAWLNDDTVSSRAFMGFDFANTVLKALVAHVYFAWIHPYADGNGRMARLIECAVLLRAGLPPVSAMIPSYFYFKSRRRYYRELQNTHGDFINGAYPPDTDILDFVHYALEGLRNDLSEVLREVRGPQQRALGHHFIRGLFPESMTSVQQRRMRLVIFMVEHYPTTPLTFVEIADTLDVIHQTGAEQSDFSLDRDLEALIKMGLLKRGFLGYQPSPQIIATCFGDLAKPSG